MLRKTFILITIISFSINTFAKDRESNGNLNYKTIGVGVDCDYDVNGGFTLTDVLATTIPEIRLANNTVYTGQFTPSVGVILRGGYANCTDANDDIQSSSASILDANHLGTVLSITNNGSYRLENIKTINGQTAGNGGGIALNAFDMTIMLDQVIVENNVAQNGAGIFKNGSNNILLIIRDSTIVSNSSTLGNGGGIYFSGDGELIIYGDTQITDNVAKNGAGLMIVGATATLIGGANPTSGISSNKASENGGGLNIDLFSNVTISGGIKNITGIGSVGVADANFNIFLNEADSDNNFSGSGGGIYIHNSIVNAEALSLVLNKSNTQGGGVAIFSEQLNTTEFNLSRPLNTTCQIGSGEMGCNIIAYNFANMGGAIYSASLPMAASKSTVSSTSFNNNRANTATAVYVLASELSIHSSVLHDNGNLGLAGFQDKYVLYVESLTNGEGKLDIIQTTAIKNKATISFIHNNNSSLNSYVNFYYNDLTGPWLSETLGSTLNTQFDCQRIDDANNTDDAIHSTLTSSPLDLPTYFIDLVNYNYHLKDNSLLVDYTGSQCIDNPGNTPVLKDIDGDPRTLRRDLGADENLSNDIIFKNDFE